MAGVLYERRRWLAQISINRPERLNAMSRELLDELGTAFKRVEKERDLRVVVLTGTGDAFCSGTDISELIDLDVEGARNAAGRGQQVCQQIERCSIPVIAAVNGVAAGGGCELALACHLRVGSTNAQFSLPETKLGVIPGYGGSQRLAREIGRGRALDIMLTGRSISAEEALCIGLLNHLSEPVDLLSAAEFLGSQIAQLAPLAVRACLQAVVQGMELSLEEGLALEADCFARLFTTKDMREGTRAFIEKRVPQFTGT